MKNAHIKNQQKLDRVRALKQEGHDIIDRIARIGITRGRTYELVAATIGCSEEMAHFHNVFTVRECQQRIKALRKIEEDRRSLIARKREETAKERAERPAEVVSATGTTPSAPVNRKGRRSRENWLPREERLAALERLRIEKERAALPWWRRLYYIITRAWKN